MSKSETILAEGLKSTGLRPGLASITPGVKTARLTGRWFRDTGRVMQDGTRVFELDPDDNNGFNTPKETTLRLWFPFDETPVTLHTSREQLESLRDELRGVKVFPGWREYIADQIDDQLRSVFGPFIPTEVPVPVTLQYWCSACKSWGRNPHPGAPRRVRAVR